MTTLRMLVFVCGVLFSVHFISNECEGKIISPPNRTVLIFLPGTSENITWKFDDEVAQVTSRTWYFTSSDGLRSGTLGVIAYDRKPNLTQNVLSGVNIIKPATLVLNNVNHSYDGVYTFDLQPADVTYSSEVTVYIARKPTVTFSYASPVRVTEGDDVTCVCTGEGGVPAPANVTWYKDGVQIGETKKENNTLTVTDVNVTDSGTYKCVAQSYPTNAYKDEKSIQIIVNVNSTTRQPSTGTTADASRGTDWYIVMVSLVSGILLALSLV